MFNVLIREVRNPANLFLTYGHGTFSFVYTRKDDIIAVAIPHDFPVVFRVEMIYVKGQPDDVQHFFLR